MKQIKHIITVVIIILVVGALYQFGIIDSVSGFFESAVETDAEPSVSASNTLTTVAASPLLPDDDYTHKDLFTDGRASAVLVEAIDGDTALFNVGGETYKTRFLAIDTPEVDPELREVEPWGSTASAFTKDKLRHADEIVLELDPNSDTFDRYDRLLAWVWVNGELLNAQIVSEGLAEVAYLYGDYQYTDVLLAAQKAAQAEGKKIWGESDPGFGG